MTNSEINKSIRVFDQRSLAQIDFSALHEMYVEFFLCFKYIVFIKLSLNLSFKAQIAHSFDSFVRSLEKTLILYDFSK